MFKYDSSKYEIQNGKIVSRNQAKPKIYNMPFEQGELGILVDAFKKTNDKFNRVKMSIESLQVISRQGGQTTALKTVNLLH